MAGVHPVGIPSRCRVPQRAVPPLVVLVIAPGHHDPGGVGYRLTPDHTSRARR